MHTTQCYRIADLVNGGFGLIYTDLVEAQIAYNCAIEDGTKAQIALVGEDEAGARADASKFLFLCVVEQDGTLTEIN